MKTVLPASSMVVAMLVLLPYVLHLGITSWTVGWVAILAGTVTVLGLLALFEHLTAVEADEAPGTDSVQPGE
ncbi:hypothetical protein ACIBEA_42685 [Streptomyces sp. NPDC051555]|uniref:hypothetical protein n=1 Tax=Streptomyces sp. NPDC051555 TaxID=3365657 RepID=UPI0037B6DBBA